ncbi:MAG: hypothetical protein ACRDQV_10450 [Pseudonocardiaceae bacterium]
MSESKSQVKPFEISKRVVWEAYRRVKANKGSAGVEAALTRAPATVTACSRSTPPSTGTPCSGEDSINPTDRSEYAEPTSNPTPLSSGYAEPSQPTRHNPGLGIFSSMPNSA